jgi:hypothetical protein
MLKRVGNTATKGPKLLTAAWHLPAMPEMLFYNRKTYAVAAQMYELVTRKIPQIVWAESGSYLIAY